VTPRLFLSSDHHFGHHSVDKDTGQLKGILQYCPGRAALWSTIEEMNEGIVERHNSVVTPDDYVVFLGDVGMGKRSESLQYVKRMNGRYKALICGNHDNPWEHGRDGMGTTPAKHMKHLMDYYDWGGFNHIDQGPRVLGGLLPGLPDPIYNCILTHLPPVECGDHKAGESVYDKEIRFVKHRPEYPPEDTWMLCGHVHEAWKRHGRVINVGVDVWDFYPVSVDQLLEVMKEG
jgi:calcineurin-like phosphoesterase family protein